jgi:hypothetical protein
VELLRQYGELSKKEVLEACKKLGLKGIEVHATDQHILQVLTSVAERIQISNRDTFLLGPNSML